jgi:transitional endoplasmic reticulum ATPase
MTPCFWLTNEVDSIDPAHIRRFDMVIELKIPPKNKRIELIRKYADGLKLSDDSVSQLADQKHLSPAVIERCSKVSKLLNASIKQQEKGFIDLVTNSLKGMRLYDKKLASTQKIKPLLNYDLNLVNTDKNIPNLIDGLKQTKSGRLCFYGVPGTGKTALASHIAKELEMPLLVKRGSDLLGMYVGQSEKNIASMFEEAVEKKALLVLDEADSFLRDRGLANQSWEVTQVNELLTQMETFEGLFICTTNLMDNLDTASIRRFDLKLEFNYLLPNQAWKMFIQLCKKQGFKAVDYKRYKQRLQSMKHLAPGDFALLVRQYRFAKALSVEQIVEDLAKEQELKGTGVVSSIGFI